jgi:hypothetical protein
MTDRLLRPKVSGMIEGAASMTTVRVDVAVLAAPSVAT